MEILILVNNLSVLAGTWFFKAGFQAALPWIAIRFPVIELTLDGIFCVLVFLASVTSASAVKTGMIDSGEANLGVLTYSDMCCCVS